VEEPYLYYNNWLIVFFYINNITVTYKKKDLSKLQIVTDFINQVSQLLRAELKELVDVVWTTIEPIKLCDGE